MTTHNDWRLARKYAFNAAGYARAALGWKPDPKQADTLASGKRRVILNCARQWGKSTVAASKMFHVAMTRPGRTVVIVCENLAQSGELFRIIDGFLTRLDIRLRRDGGRKYSRKFPNGSRIIAIAAREAAVRGYTADFVFLDEAARIPDDVIDALDPVTAIQRGDWWMASTPQGKRGRFFEMWEHGEDDSIQKVRATAAENPRMDPAFVERARRERGDAYVRQEYDGEFVENGSYLLDRDQILAVCVK